MTEISRSISPPPRGSPLDILVGKLAAQSQLGTSDREALCALPLELRSLPPQSIILREGDHSLLCPVLLSGFAFRYKITADGGRQIVALRIPGDPLDFQSLYLKRVDHHIQALTSVELAFVPLHFIEKLAEARPAIARAILVDILIEASIGREWQLNVGRRSALARLSHFLCEFCHRMRVVEPTSADDADVPITQEQLADMLGLTPVHINRTLKKLEQAGAVKRDRRRLTVANLGLLEAFADYSSLYLHRDNVD